MLTGILVGTVYSAQRKDVDDRKTLSLSATLAILILGAMAILSAQVTRPGETMQLWEYHTEIVRGPGPGEERLRLRAAEEGWSDSMLNSWGRDGWELVGFTRREIRVDDALQTETAYTFKRPTRSVSRDGREAGRPRQRRTSAHSIDVVKFPMSGTIASACGRTAGAGAPPISCASCAAKIVDDRAHRSRLFAAVLQLDGEHTGAPRWRQQRDREGAADVIAAVDRARLSRSKRGSRGVVRVALDRRQLREHLVRVSARQRGPQLRAACGSQTQTMRPIASRILAASCSSGCTSLRVLDPAQLGAKMRGRQEVGLGRGRLGHLEPQVG